MSLSPATRAKSCTRTHSVLHTFLCLTPWKRPASTHLKTTRHSPKNPRWKRAESSREFVPALPPAHPSPGGLRVSKQRADRQLRPPVHLWSTSSPRLLLSRSQAPSPQTRKPSPLRNPSLGSESPQSAPPQSLL